MRMYCGFTFLPYRGVCAAHFEVEGVAASCLIYQRRKKLLLMEVIEFVKMGCWFIVVIFSLFCLAFQFSWGESLVEHFRFC